MLSTRRLLQDRESFSATGFDVSVYASNGTTRRLERCVGTLSDTVEANGTS